MLTAKKQCLVKDNNTIGVDIVKKDLKKIVIKVAKVRLSDIKDSTNIREDLGVDSLNAMEILAAIEIKYGITIDEAKAFDIITFKDLCELIENYLRDKG